MKQAGTPVAQVQPAGRYEIDLFQAEPRAGTAVVVLLDTSGSMAQAVGDGKGRTRPKHEMAREAIAGVIDQSERWKKAHPQTNLQWAMYTFSSSVSEAQPIGDFDPPRARAALERVPRPNSGTAIGKALEAGFKALYRSGCSRKFLVCVTDGENTTGPAPAWVAEHLFARTNGEVEMQFIAFDTASSHFRFVDRVNGKVVQASDGQKLRDELTRIYETRILVEKEEPPGQ